MYEYKALRSGTAGLVLAIGTVGAIAFLGVVCLGFAFGAVLGAVQGGVLRDAGVRDTETWWWRMGLVWTAATLALVAPPVLVLVVSVIGLALLPGQVAGLLTGVAMRRMIQPHGPPSTVEAAPALPEPALVAAGAADAEAEVREV